MKSLDGVWNFRLSDSRDPELGFREEWFKRPLADSQVGVSIQDDHSIQLSHNILLSLIWMHYCDSLILLGWHSRRY